MSRARRKAQKYGRLYTESAVYRGGPAAHRGPAPGPLQIGLPVVQAALQQQEKLTQAHESFLLAVRGLEVNLARLFPDMPDAIVLFYLGLCDSAGYATTLAEKPAVLLGVEKIIELGWCDENAMKGLLYHEALSDSWMCVCC